MHLLGTKSLRNQRVLIGKLYQYKGKRCSLPLKRFVSFITLHIMNLILWKKTI
ncbi:hypothetical protein Gogos_010242 [Gossypium gossypioides]|uniref:Uncharacterized protein n=1 Tax=Gossypium gossypioides TaxID=34282 RepID=A0A7J9BKP3_GOSGO|nr:hypothetical protein [Gossypium gossypioides]